MIVIDASALTDFLIGRTAAIAAVSGEFAGHEHTALHAPELVEPETLSALRRLARSGALTDARASAALADLGGAPARALSARAIARPCVGIASQLDRL